jgi:mannan endo-1,4-beta-mannosidase
MNIKSIPVLLIAIALFSTPIFAKQHFVTVKNQQFYIGKTPYYFIGTNYWYGSLLGLEKDKKRGVERLKKELDFLQANGVTNLRIIAGAEGSGLLNGINRVAPPLQPVQGKFNEEVLDGLDILLDEMSKRKLKAVIFFSNNWEWSGGFQQYLIWNKIASKDLETRKPDWDELRDIVSKFYGCTPCKLAYNQQVKVVMNRVNKFNKKRYIDDETIMAWELANEPRPMRPVANDDYKKWISDVAAMIKKRDKNHLVTLGHEGRIGTESMSLFEEIHADKNVDYLTIHIWAKNWNWLNPNKFAETYPNAVKKATDYVNEHIEIAEKLKKPLVIEEFGLPRDGQSFDINSPTTFRDDYYSKMFAFAAENKKSNGVLAGASFWAFGGTARPVENQVFWKKGDEFMGDPPMEEQGLNTVFAGDKTTWAIINKYANVINAETRTK